jgi:hypothetical protein
MRKITPAAPQNAAETIEKRARRDAFDFDVPDVGVVRVTNRSHADPVGHAYHLDVDLRTVATTPAVVRPTLTDRVPVSTGSP